MEILTVQFIFFNLFFLIGVVKNDFSTIDIGWSLSFLTIFLTGYLSSSSEVGTRILLIGILVSVWALRLSSYILLRSLKKNEEDYRYKLWRNDWEKNVNLNAYFRVYMLQALLSLIIASPLFLIFKFSNMKQFGNWSDVLGVILFLAGFFFESVSDYQKNEFKKIASNKSKILKSGLWKYSRHPNYFGEALLWWGIFFIVINIVPFYLAVIGPLILHIFLIKVSGVSLLEKKYKSNLEYENYKLNTNSFIPFIKFNNRGKREK